MHHDIKLENVLVKVNREGIIDKIKLADFGLARPTSDKLLAGVHSQGTLEYAAPEMLTYGKEFNCRIDTWCIGIIFFMLLFDSLTTYPGSPVISQKLLSRQMSLEFYPQPHVPKNAALPIQAHA